MLPEFFQIENYIKYRFDVTDRYVFKIPNQNLTDKLIVRYFPTFGNQVDSGLLVYSVRIPGFGTYSQESYQVPPSLPNNERFIDLDLDPSLPVSLEFTCPTGTKQARLEVFCFNSHIEILDFQSIMPSTNPSIVDSNAIAAALLAITPQIASQIGQQVGATTQQALTAETKRKQAKFTQTKTVDLKSWSGDIRNHKIVDAHPNRLQSHLINVESNSANTRGYLIVGLPDGRDNTKYDDYIDRAGQFTSTDAEDTLPIYGWVDINKPTTKVNVSEYFTDAASAALPPTP